MSNPMITVTDLTKSYDSVKAVNGISFTVGEGELFGFLGPNGAGKTTTINMLTGLARRDSGTIQIGGLDCSRNPKAAQHLTGIVPDESNLYPELTGFDNLCFCAALFGVRRREREARARHLLETFDLLNAADRKFGAYSKGMKRKLTIAAGIIHQPRILFLDEPTTGIDVASARQIRQLVADFHRNGTTIFLTTHYIEEAERLCERIAFIVNGQIVREDTVAHLLQPVKSKQAMMFALSGEKQDLINSLGIAFPHYGFRREAKGRIRIEAGEVIHIGPLVRFFEEHAIEVNEARRIRPSLEDVFVEVTGIEPDELKKEKQQKGGVL